MNTELYNMKTMDNSDVKILLLAFPIVILGIISIIYLEEINVHEVVIDNTASYYGLVENVDPLGTSKAGNWGSNWAFEHSCKGQEIFYGVWDTEFLSYCNV
jgi:hypothetical protein